MVIPLIKLMEWSRGKHEFLLNAVKYHLTHFEWLKNFTNDQIEIKFSQMISHVHSVSPFITNF